jgi:hypothetical protein
VGPGATIHNQVLVEYGFLSGRITDPVDGVSGVQVVISPTTSPELSSISSNVSGYYTSDQYLEPGVFYTATYTVSGYIAAERIFEADEGLNRINLVMSQEGDLQVTVLVGSTPTGGYVVTATCDQAKCDGDSGSATSAAGSGIALIQDLIPGRYVISVDDTSYSARVNVRSGPETTYWTVVLP